MMMIERFSNMPANIRRLPKDHRGFPVPWFVPWIGGKPVFPAQEAGKAGKAWQADLCWVCGQKLGRLAAYVIGPMCAVNRTSSEPPSHIDCARFSAKHCPFLSNPRMRRTMDMQTSGHVAGHGISRNPGVTLLWMVRTRSKGQPFWAGNDVLFEIGKRHHHEWWSEGRIATRSEILESIESGLPLLEAMIKSDPDPAEAAEELGIRKADALKLVPA